MTIYSNDLMVIGWLLAPDKQTGMSFLSSALKILPSLNDRKKGGIDN